MAASTPGSSSSTAINHASVTVEVSMPADKAQELAARALGQVGTLTPGATVAPFALVAKVRHGLLRTAKTHVRIEALGAARAAVHIESKGIDLTGATQRSATRRVVDALNRGHEPGYVADRWGEPVWVSVATVVFAVGVGVFVALVLKPHEWFK